MHRDHCQTVVRMAKDCYQSETNCPHTFVHSFHMILFQRSLFTIHSTTSLYNFSFIFQGNVFCDFKVSMQTISKSDRRNKLVLRMSPSLQNNGKYNCFALKWIPSHCSFIGNDIIKCHLKSGLLLLYKTQNKIFNEECIKSAKNN